MTLFTPMRALTVVIEWGLDALATILEPRPGVPDEYLRAAVGADELAEDEAEEEVRAPQPPGAWNYGSAFGGPPERDIKWSVNTEPPLNVSEFVAVLRQLLEEHSNFRTPCADGAASDPGPAAQDGPAPGNSTGKVTPGAGHLSDHVYDPPHGHFYKIQYRNGIPLPIAEHRCVELTRADLIYAAQLARQEAKGYKTPAFIDRCTDLADRFEAAAVASPN